MAQPEDIRKPLGRANTHVEEESIDIIGEASNSGDDDTKIDKEEPRQLTGATEQSSECLLPDTPTAAFGETINRGDDEAPVDTFTYIAVGGRKRTPSLSLEHEDAGCDEETIPINDVVEQPPECIPKEDFVDVIGVIGDSGDDQATVPTKKKGGRKRTSSLTIVSADTKIDEEETHQLIGATDQSSEFPLQEKSTNVLGEATNSEDDNVSVATVPNIQKGDRRRTSSLTIVNDDTKIDEEEQHQLAGATEQTSECLLRDDIEEKSTSHRDASDERNSGGGQTVGVQESRKERGPFPLPPMQSTATYNSSCRQQDTEVDDSESPFIGLEGRQDRSSCLACQRPARDVVIRPCGHLLYCWGCVDRMDKCRKCDRAISDKIKIKTD
ncbi:uncharacterized protein LOC128214841 isoform X2 [Mya arenaria]|uniref:uncharacterized protein LOC128214841 isoform X2 n=1 Tax=Mya arenaria TaxID=6604 RepID=UPI0022E18404|nr:uncharacterized protein LOC128214841 isoform X2 [Mya arenaria]